MHLFCWGTWAIYINFWCCRLPLVDRKQHHSFCAGKMNWFSSSTVERTDKMCFQSIVTAGRHIQKQPLLLNGWAAMNGITPAVEKVSKQSLLTLFSFVAAVVYVHPQDFNDHYKMWHSSTYLHWLASPVNQPLTQFKFGSALNTTCDFRNGLCPFPHTPVKITFLKTFCFTLFNYFLEGITGKKKRRVNYWAT